MGDIMVSNNALDISYNYDIRGQLLEERMNGASVCYAYDKAGNRIRKTDIKGATLYQFNGMGRTSLLRKKAVMKKAVYI